VWMLGKPLLNDYINLFQILWLRILLKMQSPLISTVSLRRLALNEVSNDSPCLR
jgi:hypothetical protein